MAKFFEKDTSGTLLTSLVSYWKLDSSEADFYGSQNWTNNGSVGYTTGKIGNAVNLVADNTKYLSRTTPVSTATTDWSVSLWVNLPDTSEIGFFFANGVNTDLSAGYSIGVGGATISAAGNRLFFSLGNVVDKDSGTNIGTGWHHLILLRNNSDGIVRAYIDGSQTVNTHTATIVAPNGNSTIGGNFSGYSALLNAVVDEVGIWDKALSAQEISDLYNGGSGQTMVDINFDSVTVSEAVQISYSLPSPIFDSVTVSENIVLNISFPLNVNDSVTVSEDIVLLIPSLVPSVFDSVTVSEDIVLSIPLPISVFDLIIVTENVVEDEIVSGSLFDSITVSENVSLSIPLPVSVFDSATVSENYYAIKNTFGYNIPEYAPQGSLLEMNFSATGYI